MSDIQTIYLDNNATTAVAPEVLEAMLPYLTTRYGNPGSIHRFGGMVRRDIDEAREKVAALLGAKPAEIIFTASGSEADNMAIQGMYRRFNQSCRLVTSEVEHPAVRNTCRELSKSGADLMEIGVNPDGTLKMADFDAAPVDERTLASFMWANNETGMLFPIAELAEKTKEKGGFFHTDAVQAVGKVPIDTKKVPVDFLALSGHKLHAPKGVGALYIREKTKLPALVMGGHQEHGLRAGTENVASIVGLGRACELAMSRMEEENTRVLALRNRLQQELLARCEGVKLNGHPDLRLPNTLNVSFEFIEGEAILLLLDEKGICASSGSACTTGSLEPSHVMLAMGMPYTFAHSSTRISLSTYSTDAEIDAVIRELPPIVKYLRTLSPFVK